MKKSFADSEPEWRKLAEQSEKEKVGAIVATNKHSSQAKEERPRPYQRRRQFTDLDKD